MKWMKCLPAVRKQSNKNWNYFLIKHLEQHSCIFLMMPAGINFLFMEELTCFESSNLLKPLPRLKLQLLAVKINKYKYEWSCFSTCYPQSALLQLIEVQKWSPNTQISSKISVDALKLNKVKLYHIITELGTKFWTQKTLSIVISTPKKDDIKMAGCS